MYLRVGINGFGRIGRIVLRACLQNPELQVAAINDPALDVEYICYLIKFDSTHGKLERSIVQRKNEILINGDVIIRVYNEKAPPDIPWHLAGVNYVVESSGMFTTMEKASGHLTNDCVKQVIVTAPSIDIPMIILGVNDEKLTTDLKIVSAASSTLYCLAPIIKILEDNYGVSEGFVTSIHAMTPSMKPLDGLCLRGKHWRDHRSAVQNIIPAATGACKALGKIIPQSKDKLTGLAFRVPIVNVSVLDLTVKLKTPTSLESIGKEVEEAGRTYMKNIVNISNEEAVSSDFMKDSHSCILDLDASLQLRPTSFKLICWYENEYSYACRVLDYMILNEKKYNLSIVESCCLKVIKSDCKSSSYCQYFKGDAKENLTILTNKMSIYRIPEVASKFMRQKVPLDVKIKREDILKTMICNKSITNKALEAKLHPIPQVLKKTQSLNSPWNKKKEMSPTWPDSKKNKNFHDFGSKYTQNLESVRPHQNNIDKIKQHFNRVAYIKQALMQKSCSHNYQSSSKISEDFNAIVAQPSIQGPASSFDNATYVKEVCERISNHDDFKKFKSENDVLHDTRIPQIVSTAEIVTDDCKKKDDDEVAFVAGEESKVLCVTNFDSIVRDPVRMSPQNNSIKNEYETVQESKDDENNVKNSIMKINENENYCTESFSSESSKRDADASIKDINTITAFSTQEKTTEKENKSIDHFIINQKGPALSHHTTSIPEVVNRKTNPSNVIFNNKYLLNQTTTVDVNTIVVNNGNDCYSCLDHCPFLDMKTKEYDVEVGLPRLNDYNVTDGSNTMQTEQSLDDPSKSSTLNDNNQMNLNTAGPSNMILFNKLENTDPSQCPSEQFTTCSSKGDVFGDKNDIYDKLESKSPSNASESSFQISEKKSQIIKLSDISKSLEDLDRLDKICKIIEISDDFSDQLFSNLDSDVNDANIGGMWSFNEMCQKIKLEEFYDKKFGGNSRTS